MKLRKFSAAILAAALSIAPFTGNFSVNYAPSASLSACAMDMNDFPEEFRYAADWIWTNRIEREQSTVRRNTIFDQIVAGKGTINYVVKWQSYKTVTYEQRQQFEQMLSKCINDWNDWLAGYDGWLYDHIDVKIVGWAVIDKSCLLDLHDDEIVYTDTQYYNAQYDTTNGRETIPDREPFAPSALSRFDHFTDKNYQYPGGLDKRFDMYMWATQGFPDIGGCGGDWGQRLSDNAYLNMISGSGIHVLEHEIGHGFGMTDFYGGEGESDGFPPGGFPGGENSIMMAGSAAKITNFDGWMLRYMWSKIKDDAGRFDLANAQPVTTTTTTVTTTSTTTTETTTTTTEPVITSVQEEFTDTVSGVELNDGGGSISFQGGNWFSFSGNGYFSGDESRNLSHYEPGDRVTIKLTYDPASRRIISVDSITLVQNSHVIKGDVDGNGVVNVADAVLLTQFILGKRDITIASNDAADVNSDGRINSFDLIDLRDIISGK